MGVQEIICQRLFHIPAAGVESIQGTYLEVKEGFTVKTLNSQFAKITGKVDRSPAGPMSTQTLEIISLKIDDDQLRSLEHSHQIFRVHTDQGRIMLFGDKDHPAVLTSRESQMDPSRMTFTCQRPA